MKRIFYEDPLLAPRVFSLVQPILRIDVYRLSSAVTGHSSLFLILLPRYVFYPLD